MERNKRYLTINGKTDALKFYDYSKTNAYIIKFVNSDFNDIKKYFGSDIITEFNEVDAHGNTISSECVYLKRKQIFIENTFVVDYEKKLVRKAYDEEMLNEDNEPIIDPLLDEPITIHHDDEYQIIEHQVPVEMITIYLEVPELQDELSIIKNQIYELNNSMQAIQKKIIAIQE